MFPHVTAEGVRAETMLCTGEGFFPLPLPPLSAVAGGEEVVPEDMNGFLRLAANDAARLEFALLKDLESSGLVDRL